MKGPTTRNTLVKYESPGTYQSEVMTKVKVFKMKVKGDVCPTTYRYWYISNLTIPETPSKCVHHQYIYIPQNAF
jgi:hypothetical protein